MSSEPTMSNENMIDRRNWILNKCKIGDRILDIGSTDGHIFRNTDIQKYVTSIDIDKYDFDNFYQMDAHDLKFPNKYFDIAILAEILEHVNEPVQVLREAQRVAKRIIITVPDEENWSPELFPFEPYEETGKRTNRTLEQMARDNNPAAKEFYTKDNYKHLFHNRHYDEEKLRRDLVLAGIQSYKMEKLQYGNPQWSFFVVDANCNDETARQAIVPTAKCCDAEFKELESNTRDMIKLNIGSFTVMEHDWENWDIIDLSKFASDNGFNFKQVDIRNRLPKDDNSVGLINCSHIIEHLTREDGKKFLLECLRIMAPNGIIRITVPDTKLIVEDYLKGTISRHGSHNEDVKKSEDDAHSLFHLLLGGHQTIYDENSLTKLLKNTGFVSINKQKYKESYSKELEIDSANMFAELSLYIEASKNQSGPMLSAKAVINPINIQQNIDIQEISIQVSKGEQAKLSQDIQIQQPKEPMLSAKADHIGPIITVGQSNINPGKLRIALTSTPFFKVPPDSYGGLEQVVYDLAIGLDELGHQITIFGPEGSKATPHGELIVTGPSINTVGVNWLESEKQNYERYKHYITPENFDIIHDHSWFCCPYLSKMNNPKLKVLHTNHGGYSWEDLPAISHPNLVAISKFIQQYTIQYFAQRGYNTQCRFVYNGVNLERYTFDPSIKRTDRLLYIGRFSSFKRPDMAIRVAKKANIPIDLIGGTFVDDQDYLHQIESMCDGKDIAIFKDSSHEFKIRKLQEAKALVIPSKMGEPFGLTCVEGMSCGTPLITTRDGAIPEIVVDGVTGFLCNDEQDMIEAIKNIDKIDPFKCRKHVEDNFSRLKMAEQYLKLYRSIIDGDEW